MPIDTTAPRSSTFSGGAPSGEGAPPRVRVIGGGIGGLTLAALLHARGVTVAVDEQSTRLAEVGAGVQLSANAMKVLRALGVEREVRDRAFEPEHFIGWSWRSGRRLYRTPLRPMHESRYGAPYLHVHRADLHDVLRAALPAGCLRLGRRLERFEQHDDGVIARFTDGEPARASVLVGADGIHSAVRRGLFGDEAPRFTGHVCWRGLIPADALPAGHVPPAASNWMGPHGHVVQYYLRRGELVNFVAIRDSDTWTAESWTTPSSRDELLGAFPGWHRRLTTVFERAEGLHKWGLFDRDPLSHWSVGRVTLMGDAAHPMLPFLAQGAAQAIEDAYALADWIAANPDDPVAALRAYEAERLPRTRRIQLGARARGLTVHLASPWARLRRDLGFLWRGLVRPGATQHQAEWIFEHDVTRTQRRLPPSAATAAA